MKKVNLKHQKLIFDGLLVGLENVFHNDLYSRILLMNSKSDSKASFFMKFSKGYNYRSDDVVESDESFSMLNHGPWYGTDPFLS